MANLKVEIQASVNDFVSKMDNAKKSVENVEKSTKGASKSIDDLGKSSSTAQKSVSDLSNAEKRSVVELLQQEKAVKRASKELKNMESQCKSLTSSLSGAFSSLSSGDIGGFVTSIKNAGSSFNSLIPTMTAGTASVGGLTTAFSALGSSIYVALGPIGLIAGAVAAFGAVAYKSISVTQDYQKSLNEFSALTGMTGEALDDMGNRARDMAVKFGSSATDIIDSMKLIGSQAPQLLKDAEGMEKVTESAIVLSKASGMEVADSAKAITTIMNQMGVSASEATNVINSLASGSKEGAADVEYLTTSIEKSGTIASSVGLSYQQLIGVIETLAPKFSSADVAGTQLRGSLLKLSTQTNKDFNPAIVGLQSALDNLAKANLSDAELTKLVGEANLTATKTLIDERSEVERLTTSVTDTNTAFEQMETQSGLISQSWDKLAAACNDLWIEIGKSELMELLTEAIKGCIWAVEQLVDWLKVLVNIYSTTIQVVVALTKKLWNEVKPAWDAIKNTISDSAIFEFVKMMWNNFVDTAVKAVRYVSDIWQKFMKWLGLQKENLNVTASVTTTTNTQDKTQKNTALDKILAEEERKREEAAKKAAQKAGDARRKEEERQAKKDEAQQKKNAERIAEQVQQTTADILAKTKLRDQYASIGLDTTEFDIEIAKLNEKLNSLGSNFDADGIKKVKKKILDEIKKIEPEIDTTKLIDSTGDINISVGDLEKLKKTIDKIAKDKAMQAKETADAVKKAIEELIKDEEKSAREFEQNVDTYISGVQTLGSFAETTAQSLANLFSIEPDASAWDWIANITGGLSDIIEKVPDVQNALDAIGLARQALATKTEAANNQEAISATGATAANVGKALSGAASSGSSLPFPANLAAIAAGVAAVLSVISIIASAASKAKKHAAGGIIKGSTTIGDNILARVNAGEMILNKRQQSHLFNMLDKGTVATSNAQPELSFRIKGEDLVGAIKNYNNKHR